MAKQPRKSTVDYMADRLSVLTGTKFTVLRGRIEHAGALVAMRYALKAEREGYTHVFWSHKPLTNRDMTFTIASLLDMMQMGFVRVEDKESE